MKNLPTKRVFLPLAAGFGLLVIVQWFHWSQSQQWQGASAQVARGQEVRANLARLVSYIQDVQMGQRGYLLTGDKRFLDPHNFGAAQIEPQYERLLRLTQYNPARQEKLREIKPLIDQRLAHARETIALREVSGFEAAQREVMTGTGKAMTDIIRGALQEIDRQEAILLVQRSRAAQSAADLNNWLVFGGWLLIAGVFAGACWLLFQQSRARRAGEQELRRKTIMLQSILNSMGDGMAVADTDTKFLVFNPAAEPILAAANGNSTEGDLQYGAFQADQTTPFPPEQLPLARAMRGEAVSNVEMFVRHAARPEGAWLNVSGGPLRTNDGAVIGGVAVFQDVTERKVAEAQFAAASQPPDVAPPSDTAIYGEETFIVKEDAPAQTVDVVEENSERAA